MTKHLFAQIASISLAPLTMLLVWGWHEIKGRWLRR